MKAIYQMTREDHRLLAGHTGRTLMHLSAEKGNTSIRRYESLSLTTATFTPKDKDGTLLFRRAKSQWDIDDCGTFDCFSDALYVLKTTGRLRPAQNSLQEKP